MSVLITQNTGVINNHAGRLAMGGGEVVGL